MKPYILLPIAALCGLVAFVAIDACNSGNGDCPAKESITPGGSCSDDHLQCAYDLKQPASACDGTSTDIATSCTCDKGTWTCPEAFECEAGTTNDGGEEASAEAGEDDGSTQPESGPDDGGADAPNDAPDAD